MTKQEGSLAGRIVGSAAALAAVTVALKVLGFGEKRLLAHLFGTGAVVEAYAVAVKIALAGYFAARGMLRPVLVPMLTTAKNRSPEEARGLGAATALLLIAVMGGGCLVAMAFAKELVALFAPGLEGERMELAIRLTRWFLPGSAAMSLAYLLAVSLQVQKRFAAAAVGECLQKLAWIVGLVLLVAPLGAGWMIGAFWASVAAMLLFYAALHVRKLAGGAVGSLRAAPLADLFWLGWPLAAGGLVSQVGRMLQMRAASTLEPGSVAALTQYSQATVDLPLILVPLTLSIVLFPYFSEFSDRRQIERSAAYLASACRFLLIVFLPLAALTWLWREPVAHILWRSGKFGPESVHLTAEALAGLSLGLPLFALELILVPFFYAQRRMVAPMVCGAVTTVAAAVALPWLARAFGLAGVGAYLPLARMLKLGLLAACLGGLGVNVDWRSSAVFTLRLVVATAAPVAIWAGGAGWLEIEGIGRIFTRVCILTAAGAAVYSAALWVLGFEEPRQTWQWARERIGRGTYRREHGERAENAEPVS